MPTYLHPGVYVEEIPGGARPIEAVGTSTAAFVGIAEKGPIDEPKLVTNFTEYQQIFGGYVRENGTIGTSYLTYCVYQFFQNGGSMCYVVRVEKDAATASRDLAKKDGITKTMTVSAISPGLWGNDLRIAIGPGITDTSLFSMYVYKKDELVEPYEDISMVNNSDFYVDKIVKKRSAYIKTKAEDLPDNPTFTGKVLSGPVDLSAVQYINLQIDNFGPYTIDCSAGATDKSKVAASQICLNINSQFLNDTGVPVAAIEGNAIKISSPTATADSQILFTPPPPPKDKDATYDIFGLQEYSWIVKGSNSEVVALAYGLANATDIYNNLPALPGKITFSIGLGPDPVSYKDIDISRGADPNTTLFGAINVTNLAFPGVAYTDGTHVILKSAQDIHIKQANADKLLGGAFYSCATYGTTGNPAKISSNSAVASISGNVKIKIDDFPSIIVSFNNNNVTDVATGINTAFQKAAKKKQKIADASNGYVVLSSIATGTSARIIISSPLGTDAAASIFGTAHKTNPHVASDYLIPAESQLVASVTGKKDLSGSNINALASETFRISINDSTLQAKFPASIADLPALFSSSFAGNPPCPYHILTDGKFLQMLAVSITETPYLYFSIPLTGTGLGNTPADSVNAYAVYTSMFGDAKPFDDPSASSWKLPQYSYGFYTPDNNPNPTFTGDEIVTENNLSLSGGFQDRNSELALKNLALGKDGTSGLCALNNLTDISLLVIPGWSKMGQDTAVAIIMDGKDYCDNVRLKQARPLRDLFFITNTPDPTNSTVSNVSKAKELVMNTIGKSPDGYTSIYYPWVYCDDPIPTSSPTILIPPAGMVAGLYARIDGSRGVWKAPAGTETVLAGARGLADQVNDIKHDQLNPHGVNVIRKMPGTGIVAWGARTLSDSSSPWKYIPVRRTAMMIEVSIYESIQWAVFEPNDKPLWSLLRLTINAFMMNLFRNGAFQGTKPEDAFFVKCDSETTTQIDIDLGKVNILVGFAPLKPAEFVIVRISQIAGQTAQ